MQRRECGRQRQVSPAGAVVGMYMTVTCTAYSYLNGLCAIAPVADRPVLLGHGLLGTAHHCAHTDAALSRVVATQQCVQCRRQALVRGFGGRLLLRARCPPLAAPSLPLPPPPPNSMPWGLH